MLAVELLQILGKHLNLPKITSAGPPISMTLAKSINLPAPPYTVAKNGDVTLVGLSNGKIIQINNKTNTQSVLVNIGVTYVSGVHVKNSEVYVLSELHQIVNVYDLTGHLLRSWKHDRSNGSYNKLTIVNDKVIIPSRKIPSLTVYSLHGKLIRQIKVPGMTLDRKALALCEDDSVVLLDWVASCVYRVNIDSGKVMWTSKHVQRPQGVVCYKDRYVLVTNQNPDTRIWILDINTGKNTFWQVLLNILQLTIATIREDRCSYEKLKRVIVTVAENCLSVWYGF